MTDLVNHQISDESLEYLAESPSEAFVQLERISRDQMIRAIGTMPDGSVGSTQRLKYITDVVASARALEIEELSGLRPPSPRTFSASDFDDFLQAVDLYVTQARILNARQARRSTIALDVSRRERIEHYVQRLRDRVEHSDLDEVKRRRLNERLDEFERELGRRSVNVGAALVIIAAVVALVSDAKDLAPDAARLVEGIYTSLGSAIEEVQQKALSATRPVPALESPRTEGGESKG